MARIVGVREQLAWTWFDTLLSADGPCEVPQKERLFDARTEKLRCGQTNWPYPNHLPPEMTFVIMSMPLLVHFDNEKLYGAAGRGLYSTLTLEDKVVHEGPARLNFVRADAPPAESAGNLMDDIEKALRFTRSLKIDGPELHTALVLLGGVLAKPINIYVRARVGMEFEFRDDTHRLIGESGGFKSMVQCLRGQLTRDIL